MILDQLFQGLISFGIAFLLAFATMLFGTYHLNHSILLKRPRYLIWYSFMYGMIAFIVTLIVLCTNLTVNEYKVYESPWIVAIIIGFAYKAVANINLFSFNLGQNDLNFGFKLITEFMDRFFNKRIRDDVDLSILPIINDTSDRLADDKFKDFDIDVLFERALPSGFTEIEADVYMKQIKEFSDLYDKCNYFAKKFGHKRLIILKEIISQY